MPEAWRCVVRDAIGAGLVILSGLHELISEDAEFVALASGHGIELVDHRRAPDVREVARGRAHLPGKRVVLTVGTDCAVGKLSVALEMCRAALAAGLAGVFVPTGQTGIVLRRAAAHWRAAARWRGYGGQRCAGGATAGSGALAGLAMIRRARVLGLRVMLGCMEETSVAIAAAATLGSLVDRVHLDGDLLLGSDPFEGLELSPDRSWRLPESPGTGIRERG